MSEPLIAREVAEAEFDRWVAGMRLTRKLDPSKLNDQEKSSLATTKETIIGAIEDRRLVVNEAGLFVFTADSGKVITFYKPTGATLMAIDSAKAGAGVQKSMKFLADMTREPAQEFAKIDLVDLEICDAIAALFLAR